MCIIMIIILERYVALVYGYTFDVALIDHHPKTGFYIRKALESAAEG